MRMYCVCMYTMPMCICAVRCLSRVYCGAMRYTILHAVVYNTTIYTSMLCYPMLCVLYRCENSTVVVLFNAILLCLSRCMCTEKERVIENILHFVYMFISTRSFTTVVGVSVTQGDSMG